MIWVDYAILAIVALSALIGFFRGFSREAIGLVAWLLAFFLAFKLAEPIAELLTGLISVRSVRLAAAFGAIFILTLIVGALINYSISKLVAGTGFSGTDRALGVVFGVLRGVAVLVLLVLIAGVTAVPQDQWWDESIFVPHLEQGAIEVREWLPEDLAEEIEFDPLEAESAPATGPEGEAPTPAPSSTSPSPPPPTTTN